MPLASYVWFHHYGPGMGAAVGTCTPTAEGTLRGRGKLAAVHTTAPTAYARPNDGRQLRAVNTIAPTAYARISGKGRIYAVGKVNELTQDDVTGAVLEAQLEGSITLKEALRLLLAVAVGKTDIDTSGPSPVITFRDTADSKNRVTATMSGSERATVVLDPD